MLMFSLYSSSSETLKKLILKLGLYAGVLTGGIFLEVSKKLSGGSRLNLPISFFLQVMKL